VRRLRASHTAAVTLSLGETSAFGAGAAGAAATAATAISRLPFCHL